MKSISAIVILPVLWQVFVRGQQPEFNAKPVNITAIKGQPAVLPCTVLHKNDYLLVWMNPRRILLSSDDRRVIDDTRMSIERPFVRDWNLHVRNVQVHDDGEYTCQINTDPIQIKRILLKVQVPAEIVNATSSTNITIREGSKVKLQCVATGTPKPSIIWYRNTPQTNDIKEHIGTSGEVLIIHNISRYCGGLYECEANNNIAKPVSRAMNVDVEFPPEVTFRTPRRISQVIGKEAMLECFVSAFPHGVGTWNKNGKPVGEGMENSWKYRKEIYKEDHFTYAIYLRIINLEAHDFGTYTCEAANPLGTDSDTMLLSEYFVPTPPPTTKGPPMHPSRHPPHNVGHSDKHYEYRHPSEDGEINIGGVHSSSGNLHTFGYVGAGESYPSRCASIFQQTTPLWCIQTTVTVTLLVYRTLFPS